MRILHEVGKWVAIEDRNGIERLRYDYCHAPKPFLHPIRLADGTPITEVEPPDHRWHRGLWFAWKFVAGVNYWEEDPDVSGFQETRALSLHTDPPSDALALRSRLIWRDADAIRLHERRQIDLRLVPDGAMELTWRSAFTAAHDLTLDRTPFTTWGGYGGLVARLRPDLRAPRILFDDGTQTRRPTGERHLWGGIEGDLPGGGALAVVFFPFEDNARAPEPFYGTAQPGRNFFGPAPLFWEPLSLKRGETLRHGVRVLILPRRIDPAEIAAWDRIASTQPDRHRR